MITSISVTRRMMRDTGRQAAVRALRRALDWQGDPEAMRANSSS